MTPERKKGGPPTKRAARHFPTRTNDQRSPKDEFEKRKERSIRHG